MTTSISNQQTCIVCDKNSEYGTTHQRCMGMGVPNQLICFFKYTTNIRKCIVNSKYRRKQFSVLRSLTTLGLRKAFKSSILDHLQVENFIVAPVPVSKTKLKSRGFNQAEIIAKEISKHIGIKVNSNMVFRTTDTKAQYTKNRTERFKNLEGAFSADRKIVAGKKILIVDDICTTGATFLEISKALYEAGADEVKCFALSKVK